MANISDVMNYINNNTLTLDYVNQNLNNHRLPDRRHITQLGPMTLIDNITYIYPVVDL